MAPELIPPVDIDHEEAYEEDGSLKNPQPPCCTKATDVFAFSMVALQASNPLLEILLTSGILCRSIRNDLAIFKLLFY